MGFRLWTALVKGQAKHSPLPDPGASVSSSALAVASMIGSEKIRVAQKDGMPETNSGLNGDDDAQELAYAPDRIFSLCAAVQLEKHPFRRRAR